MESVKGKHILVTGATGGIGAQAAKMLAASGAIVYISGRNEAKLNEVGAQLQLPANRILVADMADAASVQQMAAAIHTQVPALDIMVNAAGIGIIKPMDTLSLEDFQSTLSSNLVGPFNLLKAFLPAIGFPQIRLFYRDGYKGMPEYAPFDRIIVTCAPDHVPHPLVDQLKEGGKMIQCLRFSRQ